MHKRKGMQSGAAKRDRLSVLSDMVGLSVEGIATVVLEPKLFTLALLAVWISSGMISGVQNPNS